MTSGVRTTGTAGKSKESGRVRWGFIGAGDVAEVKSGPAFSLVEGSSVSVIMRRSADKAKDYAERHGVPRWTTDAAEVIAATDVDAVYVATPPSSHAHYTRLAAQAGKPVYVEKPMARTAAEAEAMLRACRQAGVPLFVAYYRRALPRFEFVRDLLQGGELGAPTTVNLHLAVLPPGDAAEAGWRWDEEAAGHGLLLDLGSHAFDLLDHWLGPIAEVSGFSDTRLPWSEVSDLVVGAFRFERGPLGSATFDFAAARPRDELTIELERGRVSLPVFAEGPVRVTDRAGRTTEHDIAHPVHVQRPLITAVVGELLGRGGQSPSTGTSALRTQRVLDTLLRGRSEVAA